MSSSLQSSYDDYSDADKWNQEVVKRAQDLVNMGYVPCAVAFGTKAPFNKFWTKNNDWIKIGKDFNPGKSNDAVAYALNEGKLRAKFQNPNRLNLGVVMGLTIQGYDSLLSGVPAAIDVDVNDPERAEFLDNLLTDGVKVRRFGTKGFTQFVRVRSDGFESTPQNKTHSNNQAGIEFLFTGRQSIIPPSVYLEDWRWKNDQEAFKSSEVCSLEDFVGKETSIISPYKWLTNRPLWEVPIQELPELTAEKYIELMLYIVNPESSMFNLHRSTYLGSGQGGDYRGSALSTVASFLANDISEEYIHQRCAVLARCACERGGMSDEFDTLWDIEKEIEGFIAEAKSKFSTGTWSKSSYTQGAIIKKKIDYAEKGVSITKRLSAVPANGAVVPKTLVSQKDFDEKNYAALWIEEEGGIEDWVTLVEMNTGRRDPDYIYHYAEGYWHRVPVNPRDSYLKVQLEQKYGLNSRMSPRVLESLHNFTTHADRKTFESSRTRYIKVKNGTFDVQEMELVEDHRTYSCTSMVDVEYGKLEVYGCPVYEDFLNTLFTQVEINFMDVRTDEQREKDKQLCIQAFEEWMGYTLIRDTELTRALFLKGRAQTGKNVALMLLKLFHADDQISSVALDELHLPIQRAILTEAAVNVCDEVGKREQFSEKDFKKIVQGAGVSIERKYEQPRHGVPITARLAFALNDFPSTVEINNSLERRMIFLSCNNVIPDHVKDTKLRQKFEKEKNGIFMRWVEGLRRLLERGDFVLPECHKIEIDQFRRQNDPLADFLDVEIVQMGHLNDKGQAEEAWTEKLKVYEAFRRFSELHGVKSIYSEKTFSSQLARHLREIGLEMSRRMVNGERQIFLPLKLRKHEPENY